MRKDKMQDLETNWDRGCKVNCFYRFDFVKNIFAFMVSEHNIFDTKIIKFNMML